MFFFTGLLLGAALEAAKRFKLLEDLTAAVCIVLLMPGLRLNINILNNIESSRR
jgi:hypothetical protein